MIANKIHMKYKIVRWYDERKTVTHVHSFEEAYREYSKNDTCDTVGNC